MSSAARPGHEAINVPPVSFKTHIGTQYRFTCRITLIVHHVFWWNGYPGAVWSLGFPAISPSTRFGSSAVCLVTTRQACSLIFEALEPVTEMFGSIGVLAKVFRGNAECSSGDEHRRHYQSRETSQINSVRHEKSRPRLSQILSQRMPITIVIKFII